MTIFGKYQIPLFLIFQIISAGVVGFMLWRRRRRFKLESAIFFDFIVLFIICSIVSGRLFYIVQNLGRFRGLPWSVYPFYYKPGAERIWLQEMPWCLVKFWQGEVDYSLLMFGGVLYSLLFFQFKGLLKKYSGVLVSILCLGSIVQVIGFFIGGSYFGNITDSFMGMQYIRGDGNARIPIQLIETIALILLFSLLKYIQSIDKKAAALGIYLFVFGCLEIVADFMKDTVYLDANPSFISFYGISLTQIIYLTFTITGFVFLVSVYQKSSIIESNGVAGKLAGFSNVQTKLAERSRVRFSYKDFRSSRLRCDKRNRGFIGWLQKLLSSRTRKN